MEKQLIQRNFGDKVKRYRTVNGKSQEELALESEISTAYLGQIERGMRCPTIDTLLKISRVLKISPSRLLDCEEDAENSEAQIIITNSMTHVRCEDKKKLAIIFEQIVRVYNGEY
ncbi:MAG: helix-turn-helix domain-containing protein [Oscillospiraceae bacterium]|nr:helix-turn-helix domain-containing protein [Oscillospiraceae bacterium]